VTDWRELTRAPLRAVGPYTPGASVAEMHARYGVNDLARLNWNESLFGPLPGVLDEAAAQLGEAWMYPEQAYLDLRAAVARRHALTPAHVLPGHGIQALIITLASAFVSPGDTVVVPRPTYGLYAQACRVAGAVVHAVDTCELRIDLDTLAAAARAHDARLVWVCDPNNPTGDLLDADAWSGFLDALPARCVAVADEAYMDYVAPERRPDRAADVAAGRRLVVLRTFSKIFGLAGLRLGYALVDPELAPYLNSVQEPFNVNRTALAAGVASLAREELISERRLQAVAARELLAARLRDGGLEALPSEANFDLVALRADDLVVAERLARRGLLVRAGSEFGLPGYARVTVGPSALMERAAAELTAACRHRIGAGAPNMRRSPK